MWHDRAMRCALVGSGAWGSEHLARLIVNPSIETVAVVDTDESVLASVPGRYGLEPRVCYSSLDIAIEEASIDCAIVTVPNPVRIPLVARLVEAGIPTLVEKPLVHSVEDARRIQESLRSRGAKPCILMVSQNYRFLERAGYVRGLIRSGRLGALRTISLGFCRREPFLAEGFYSQLTGSTVIALELGSHHFDLLTYLVGAYPVSVFGETWHMDDDLIAADCHLSALMWYPNGVRVSYQSTLMGGASITGWPGRFEIDFEGGHVIWDEAMEPPLTVRERADDEARFVEAPDLPNYPEESLSRCQSAFFDAVRGDDSLAAGCMFRENLRTLSTGFAIDESAESGRSIDLGAFFEERFSSSADSQA